MDEVVRDACVVSTTLTGAQSYSLARLEFDVVVIDEAAQALEAACWIALLKVLLLVKYLCRDCSPSFPLFLSRFYVFDWPCILGCDAIVGSLAFY